MIGKQIRLERIFNRSTRRSVIIPMDHGFTQGQIYGLLNMQDVINDVRAGGANAIILHKGMVNEAFLRGERDIGLIVHLSASTSMSSDPNFKVLITSVEEAIILGADAVSIHINLGSPQESKMIEAAGAVSRDCNRWGMPLLIMVYPRGKEIDQYDPVIIAHCVRVAEELGADLIKTNYPKDKNSFQKIVASCSVPVLVAGGEKCADEELFRMIDDATSAGGAGVCIGRNAFQRENTVDFVHAIRRIVHDRDDPINAENILKR